MLTKFIRSVEMCPNIQYIQPPVGQSAMMVGKGHGHIQREWQATDEEISDWFIRALRR